MNKTIERCKPYRSRQAVSHCAAEAAVHCQGGVASSCRANINAQTGLQGRLSWKPVILAQAGTVIPAKAGIQKMELIEKSNPERVDLYGELV